MVINSAALARVRWLWRSSDLAMPQVVPCHAYTMPRAQRKWGSDQKRQKTMGQNGPNVPLEF
eukprot:2983154-Amphidinium_carterae.1